MNKTIKIASLDFRIGSILVLLLGAVWIWISRVPPDTSGTETISAPTKGFPAPDFKLQDQNGNIHKLSSLKEKAVLINFWASWCPPCRAEMPAMQEVYQEYQSQGFMILAVNSTIQDNQDDAIAFYQEMNLTFPLLLDQDGAVTEAYQVRSLPTSFFIDRDGIIQDVIIGGPMAEALLIARVEKLLSSSR